MDLTSLGCQTCKTRHLKCDKTIPVCQRCQKSRRTCYRAKTVIHIENSYASRQKKRPRGPRSSPPQELTAYQCDAPQKVLPDLKSQALAYYVRYHIQSLPDTPDLIKTQYDAFFPIWASGVDRSILDLSISSLALAIFSQTQRCPQAEIDASLHYQQLLHVARSQVLTINNKDFESCLLAAFFMGRYEDSIYKPRLSEDKSSFNKLMTSAPHHEGALAMLKNWKCHMSQNSQATDIVKYTRRGLIKSALMRDRPIPDWMLDGSSFGEKGLDLEYDRSLVRIVNIRQRLFALHDASVFRLRLSEDVRSTAEDLNKEAKAIDSAFEEWTAHFPDNWKPVRYDLKERPSKHFYSKTVYSYPGPGCAAVWSLYFAMRMLMNSTRWRILRLRHPDSDVVTNEEGIECLSNIQSMADSLACTLPFTLQRFKVSDESSEKLISTEQGVSLQLAKDEDLEPHVMNAGVWPMTIASSLGDYDARLKLWFRSQLAGTGRVVGTRILLCAETDRWLEM